MKTIPDHRLSSNIFLTKLISCWFAFVTVFHLIYLKTNILLNQEKHLIKMRLNFIG